MRKQFRNLVFSSGVMFVLVASWAWGISQTGAAMFNPKEYARAWASEQHACASVGETPLTAGKIQMNDFTG